LIDKPVLAVNSWQKRILFCQTHPLLLLKGNCVTRKE